MVLKRQIETVNGTMHQHLLTLFGIFRIMCIMYVLRFYSVHTGMLNGIVYYYYVTCVIFECVKSPEVTLCG